MDAHRIAQYFSFYKESEQQQQQQNIQTNTARGNKSDLEPKTEKKTSTLMDKLMGFGNFQGSFHLCPLRDRLHCGTLHLNGMKIEMN